MNSTIKLIGSQLVIIDYPDHSKRSFDFPDELVNDSKLDNNICRARRLVREYGSCNPWEYFGTFTFADDGFIDYYDKSQFYLVSTRLTSWFKSIKKRKYPDFKYLVIPEWGDDTERLHYHGFISGVPADRFIFSGKYDKHGRRLYNWVDYPYGFNDFSLIDNINKASNYCVGKYITKQFGLYIPVGMHCYYASKGLKSAIGLYNGRCRDFIHKIKFNCSNERLNAFKKDDFNVDFLTVYLDELTDAELNYITDLLKDADIELSAYLSK